MKRLALSLLAGGLLALPTFADTTTVGVDVTSNAGTPFIAVGDGSTTVASGVYAALDITKINDSDNAWPADIRGVAGKLFRTADFNYTSTDTTICNDFIDPSTNTAKVQGVILAGITVDPGSVVNVQIDAPTALTNVNDSNYAITVTDYEVHMCYYYPTSGNFISISDDSNLNEFDYTQNSSNLDITPASGAEINQDINVPNLTSDDPPGQVTLYFLVAPAYQFPTFMKQGLYEGTYSITLTAQ
jgi:hypothetical protein